MRGICFGCCRSWASNESVRVIIKLRRPKNLINDLCGALPAVPVPGFPDPYTINLSVRASESDDLLNAVYEGHRHYCECLHPRGRAYMFTMRISTTRRVSSCQNLPCLQLTARPCSTCRSTTTSPSPW